MDENLDPDLDFSPRGGTFPLPWVKKQRTLSPSSPLPNLNSTPRHPQSDLARNQGRPVFNLNRDPLSDLNIHPRDSLSDLTSTPRGSVLNLSSETSDQSVSHSDFRLSESDYNRDPGLPLSDYNRDLRLPLPDYNSDPNLPLSDNNSDPRLLLSDLEPVQSSNKQTLLVHRISDQLLRYKTQRALKTMKELPGFETDLAAFVRNECRKEADGILSEKDPPLRDFGMADIKNFSYSSCLTKLQRVAPILISSISGAISDSKSDNLHTLSRAGFGGKRKGDQISLTPAIVQTATAILKNRHPNSISLVPAVNSLNNMTNHITSRYFYLANNLGTSFSHKTATELMDRVNESHDSLVVDMKAKVETMLSSCKTEREKGSCARAGAAGCSFFGDNVGKVISPRHNTGLSHKGYYLQMAITLGVINRIPSAHLSDIPVMEPKDVNYFPDELDLSRIEGWMKYQIGVQIVKYHPAFANCGRFNRAPEISHSAKKKTKSEVCILSLSLEDPSSNEGMIKISEALMPYLPQYPSGKNQKMALFGDQGYVERGHGVSWGRSGEKEASKRLEGLCFLPQEWHKRKEDLFIYNARFNLGKQVDSSGTLQNIKHSFGHNKATKDVSNFYPTWDLASVTTAINLIGLVCSLSGHAMNATPKNIKVAEFQDLVDQVFNKINLLNKWRKDDNKSAGVSSGPRSRSTESSMLVPEQFRRSTESSLGIREPDIRSTESSLVIPEPDRRSTESSLLVPEPFRRFAESSLGIREPDIRSTTVSSLVIPEPDRRSSEHSLVIPELDIRSTEPSLGIPEPGIGSTESSLVIPEPDRRSTESSLGISEPDRRSTESSLGIREPYIRSTESSLVIPEPDMRSTEPSLGIHELGMGSSGLSFVVPEDSLLSTETQTDEMLDFHLDLLYYGLLLHAQKSASQFGDGEGMLAYWKNSMSDYHDEKKPKYRILAHRKTAACAGCFGPKVQTDALHNIFINDRGSPDSNVEGDLKVEHVNAQFKAGLIHLCGNYTDAALQRVAKSLDTAKHLKDKLYPNYIEGETGDQEGYHAHREADWNDQIVKGVEDIIEGKVFEESLGRKMPGVNNYQRKDSVDFKGLKRFIKNYNRELKYYIMDTFK